MFKRIPLREVRYERVRNHFIRRASYLSSLFQWYNSNLGKANLSRLAGMADAHKGETCVIICNGPSLNKIDMSLVKGEVSFAMNRSYLMFEEWGFVPNYYAITNELVLRQFIDDIRSLPMPKFTDFVFRDTLRPQENTIYFRLPPRLVDKFGNDLRGPISSGGTVTFATLQIAYFLGFAKVVIIGMDHRFNAKGAPSTSEVRKDEVDRDHVHPNYFPKGMKWEFPDLVRSEMAYSLARAAYERAGRRVIDATVGGACTIFEKMPLERALRA